MTTDIKYHTKEEALRAVTENGNELEFCAPELKNDEEVTMAAVKKNGEAFRYASDTLKNNKNFILKALHEGVYPFSLIKYADISLQSDIEIMNLAVEKNTQGGVFCYAKEKVALDKELAAKALVKWGNRWGPNDFDLWKDIHPTLKEFFPRDSYFEKAQAYLQQLEYQLEQEKQAELVTGGTKEEDEVVW